MPPMRSFSGLHEFTPDILLATQVHDDTAASIVESVELGYCPRCEGAMPKPPELPAGSRITRCRSIPICGRCGVDESNEAYFDGWISGADDWPIPPDEREAREKKMQDMIDRAAPLTMTIHSDRTHVLGEHGVTELRGRAHPGGWAEFTTPTEAV